MKKILLGLLCFGLLNLTYTDTAQAKRTKKSSVSKKRKSAKYRAYKSFYRRQMRQLRKKSNWSVGVFIGTPAKKEAYYFQPAGLSLAYHVNSFVSLENRVFFGYSSLDTEDFADPSANYVVNTGISFSTLAKFSKSINRKRTIMLYAIGGYSSIQVSEENICKLVSCNFDVLEDKVSARVGLWTLGAGVTFFPIKKVSFGLEVLNYFGLKTAFAKVTELHSLNDPDLAVKDLLAIQVSAQYHF